DSQLGDMGSTRTISGGYWATTIQLYCWVEIAGGSGSGGSGPSGGGPANGFDPYCIDCGDGGDTGGNGFGLLPPPDISPELLKITRDWYTMSDERWKAVDEVFKKGLQNPYLKMMYDQLAIEPTFTFSMETFTDTSNPDENEKLGSYRDEFFFENNQSSRGIRLNEKLFTDPAYKQFLMVTLFAEMTHAYQHSVYGNTDYKKLKESVNLECEQRFFIEFVDYMSRDDTGKGIFKLTDGYSFAGSEKDQKLLESWLETIKQSPNSKPTLDNVKQKFLEFFMPRFKEVWKNTDYGKLTILLNEILYAILLLFS
nr:hypothetical protein [Microscillaceae bacterium]